MRKFLFLGLLLLVMLGVLAAPVSATPVADLTALARYFPDSTAMFFAIRTDDAYIDALDDLLDRVRGLLPNPDAIPPAISLRSLLNTSVADVFNASFDEAVRSWLGDSAAFGITSLEMSRTGPDFLLAVSITDRAAAIKFVEGLFKRSGVDLERTEGDGYTLFADQRVSGALAITQDALFVGLDSETLPIGGGRASNLAASADFSDSLAALPGSDYNILAYLNTRAIWEFQQRTLEQMDVPLPPLFRDIMNVVGSQVWGFTLADGRSLVMDIAVRINDASALEERGLVLNVPLDPVSRDFAAFIPADAPLVIQGTRLGDSVTAGFQNLRVMGALIQEIMADAPAPFYMSDFERFARSENLGNVLVAFINLSFAGVTGLNLEKEVLPWMNGQYAAYLRVLPLGAGSSLPVTLDAVALIETTDPAGPPALLTALDGALEQYDLLSYSREEIAGVPALMLPQPIRLMLPPGIRGEYANSPQFDVLIAANDRLFVLGTRPGVTFSLSPDGATLDSVPAYAEAWTYALAGAQQFWYLDTRGLAPAVERIYADMDSSSAQIQKANTLAVLGLFSSTSISVRMTEDGASVGRAVLTFAEAPLR